MSHPRRERSGEITGKMARGGFAGGDGEKATQMASEHGISSHYSRVCRLSGLRARGRFCSGQLIQASYRTGTETWSWFGGKSCPLVLYDD